MISEVIYTVLDINSLHDSLTRKANIAFKVVDGLLDVKANSAVKVADFSAYCEAIPSSG
jgi:CRISPR/Cas system CMR-associated protein Cmr5 small subunit